MVKCTSLDEHHEENGLWKFTVKDGENTKYDIYRCETHIDEAIAFYDQYNRIVSMPEWLYRSEL